MEDHKKNLNDSSDVVIIDCHEDVPRKKSRHHNRKCEYKRYQKHSSLNNKTDGLKITQKVEVKKELFSCTINLNTNISEGKNQKRKCQRKHSKKTNLKDSKDRKEVERNNICKPHVSKDYSKERIVPTCMRNNCQRLIDRKTKPCKEKERQHIKHYDRHRHQRHSAVGRKHTQQNEKPNRRHSSKQPVQKYHRDTPRSLSPISSSPLKDDTVNTVSFENINSPLYDDVSLESFRYSDNELDTLIKRTKDRERRIQKNNTGLDRSPRLTSTPLENYISISSEDESDTVFSGTMDISIHSLATLVLEPQMDTRYSSVGSESDMAEIKTENDSGYMYQNHQNLVQCESNYRLPVSLENKNFEYSLEFKKVDIQGDNTSYSPSILEQTVEYKSTMTENKFDFPRDYIVKLENHSYSPTDITDSSINCYQNIPEYNTKLESTVFTAMPDHNIPTKLFPTTDKYKISGNNPVGFDYSQYSQFSQHYLSSELLETNNNNINYSDNNS